MSDLNGLLPSGYQFRELWLPELINNNATLQRSGDDGHQLALTGARKGLTSDGVHGVPGVVTSNINLTAIHDNENILWVSFRFKLDQAFAAGAAANQHLFGKYDGVNDYLICWLNAVDGKLYMAHDEAATLETIASTETSWAANTWYHVIVSCHNVNGQRMIVNGGTAVTVPANTTAISLTAALCLMARDDGVSNEGLAGVMEDVAIGIAALTVAEEADLYKGIVPAAATQFYPLDEGRGVTAYDRGTGVNNGTLDTSCTWQFGTVKLAALSLDGINDRAQSTAGVDISGNLTLILVIKAKSTYNALVASHELIRLRVDDNNLVKIHYYLTDDKIRFLVNGGGTPADVDYSTKPAIDSYLILVGTVSSGTLKFYVNAAYIGQATGAGAVSGAAAIAYIGATNTPDQWDPSTPLLAALVAGALDENEVREVSRRIDSRFDLGVAI